LCVTIGGYMCRIAALRAGGMFAVRIVTTAAIQARPT
jgi:hypothetical protein